MAKKKKELILKLKQLKIKAQDRIKEGESDKKRSTLFIVFSFRFYTQYTE